MTAQTPHTPADSSGNGAAGSRPWIILPGMTMPPEDFARLAAALPGEARVLDAYAVALTAPVATVREWFLARGPWSQVRLVGHSAGGMAALEWLLAYPEEVECAFLLEPSDPDEPPSRLLPATAAHRAVAALLSAAGSWAWLARRLGRAGRRAFWRLFTTEPDPLPARDVDRIWGCRQGLLAVWLQVFDRFVQEGRVRALLEEGHRPTPPVFVVVGDAAEPYQAALSERLGGALARTSGDHLFPVLRPAETAELIVRLAGTPAARP
ncbi:MAG: alpha/beta hydrolase [Bifidobacteriaceae bacterium]|jgi:lipase|nr:alpha/beta hydrolase [Bifidobacteriaceae bacterium]